MKQKQRYIPGLDGLRAVSISLVMIGHLMTTLTLPNELIGTFFANNARLGVMVFFVISGYLITHILLKEQTKNGSFNLKSFYLKRVFRIFPACYAFLLAIVLLRVTGIISTSPSHIVSAASFTINYSDLWNPNDHRLQGYWFVGHFWSLSVEEQFYLIWPATLLLLGFEKSKRWILFALLCCPLVRVLTYFLFPPMRGMIPIMGHTMADPIILGCAFALWEGNRNFEALCQRLSSPLVPILSIALTVVVSPMLNSKFGGNYQVPIGILVESVSIAVLVIWTTRFTKNSLGEVLNSAPVVKVGVISYSLYLWQQLFLTPLNTTWTGRFPFNLICCFSAAVVSYHAIEKPFLVLRGRLQKTTIAGPIDMVRDPN